MRIAYTVVFYLLLPFIFLRLLWRSLQSPQYRQRWSERFGFVSRSQYPTIWFHSVSVGETIASEPLVRQLLQLHPDYSLFITTTTPTGSNQVASLYATAIKEGRVQHSYIPYDVPNCIHRFLKRVQPALVIFMETELWPNIINSCSQKNIPTLLVNARLSERSLKGYQRFEQLAKSMFSKLTTVIAQTEKDAQRIGLLGAKSIVVSGSLKSEIVISDDLQQQATSLKQSWSLSGQRKVIIAASTHKGEDEIILSVYKSCLATNKNLLLVLVPRHPERFTSVEQLSIKSGFSTLRKTSNKQVDTETQVLVGDTMGELMLMYGASDIAIVGGSFIEHGGHNMLEPAAWGLPIISGSSVFNFSQIADDMQYKKALVLCEDQQQLTDQLNKLLTSEEFSISLGIQAKAYVEKNRGALNKTISSIAEQLK